MPAPLALDDPQDVVGVEDHVVLAVEADLGPRVLGEDDNVALGNLDRHALAVTVELAFANRHDLLLIEDDIFADLAPQPLTTV